MGRESGNPMPDRDYFWGDDDVTCNLHLPDRFPVACHETYMDGQDQCAVNV